MRSLFDTLWSVICENNDDAVTRVTDFLEAGTNVNMCPLYINTSCSALHMAANDDRIEILRLLINAGAIIDHKWLDSGYPHPRGCTALMMACLTKSVRCVELLCFSGADVNTTSTNGTTTALHCALRYNFDVNSMKSTLKIIKTLVQNGFETSDLNYNLLLANIDEDFRMEMEAILKRRTSPETPKDLLHLARSKIRKLLMNKRSDTNLFITARTLQLPKLLQDIIIYNV